MLNLDLGTEQSVGNSTGIRTNRSAAGHAVYGPYEHLVPGRYRVDFVFHASDESCAGEKGLCAVLDVTSDSGKTTFARQDVHCRDISDGPQTMTLSFDVERPGVFEYRIYVTGLISIIVQDSSGATPIEPPSASSEPEGLAFPDQTVFPKPTFFFQNLTELQRIREIGGGVRIVGQDMIVTIDSISFHARGYDDIRFVEEIFLKSTYNIMLDRATCVIDIGMNLGLVAPGFASKSFVEEVHSFEPFQQTYRRALDNFLLNPNVSSKIQPRNYGLAGFDEELTVLIADDSDSGMQSIAGWGRGDPQQISVRDAASVLAPIILDARARNLAVVAKIDCEGSEYAIFDSLEKRGLLKDIHAFMVEWHRLFEGKDQRDLIEPLLRHGFTVFDQSAKHGNGFFYAVR